MRLLIFDTETTGLEPSTDVAIEVAGVVYDTALRCVLTQYSALLKTERDNPCEDVNRIPTAALKLGEDPERAWRMMAFLAKGCDCIAAHSADFDRGFTPKDHAMQQLPWCCTREGFDWPRQDRKGSRLIDLALAHGLAVVDPHRAINDCHLIARLLARIAELGVDVDPLVRLGCEPRLRIQALVSFEDKDLAKDAGFMWEPETKRWLRTMQRRKAEALGFKWQEVLA